MTTTTWGGATSFSLSGSGSWSGTTYTLDTNQGSSSVKAYEINASGFDANMGLQFSYDNEGTDGAMRMHCDVNSGGNTSNPGRIRNDTTNSNGNNSVQYSNGDTLILQTSEQAELGRFTVTSSLCWSQSSGPTVTSITQDLIIVPTDTVSVTDFTLSKDTVSYTATTSNLNLTGPTVYEGVRSYDYTILPDGSGWYTRTIDSKSFSSFYYDSSWESNTSGPSSGRGVTSNVILNTFGSIPSTTVINFPSTETVGANGWNLEMRTTKHFYYRETLSGSGNTNVFGCYVEGTSDDVKVYLYYRQERGFQVINSYTESWSIGKQATMTLSTSNAGNQFEVSVNDWVYYTEYGDGYDYGLNHVSAFTAKGNSRNFW